MMSCVDTVLSVTLPELKIRLPCESQLEQHELLVEGLLGHSNADEAVKRIVWEQFNSQIYRALFVQIQKTNRQEESKSPYTPEKSSTDSSGAPKSPLVRKPSLSPTRPGDKVTKRSMLGPSLITAEEQETDSEDEQDPATQSSVLVRASSTIVPRAHDAQLRHFACLSHEIRTPLNCIIGLSRLLSEPAVDEQPKSSSRRGRSKTKKGQLWTSSQVEAAKMIATSGELLLTVVNDVLDYAKLEESGDEVKINYQPRSNLQEVLHTVVFSLESKWTQVSIRTAFGQEVPEFITTDICRLQQILYNLLGNACKFCCRRSSTTTDEDEKHGYVDLLVDIVDPTSTTSSEGYAFVSPQTNRGGDYVSSSPRRDACSTDDETTVTTAVSSLQSESGGKVLRVRIKDYGVGIAKKDFERIFQPFRQASTETERMYGGTGLGLAVTAKLVDAFKGTISVNSVSSEENLLNSWTEFTVELPFLDAVAEIPTHLVAKQSLAVLLVDDDPTNAFQLCQTMTNLGVKVEQFTDMESMEEEICEKGPLERDCTYVCFVQESLFDEDSYDLLSNLAASVLVTYGPEDIVPNRTTHFWSPSRILPSVLVKKLRNLTGMASTVGPTDERSLNRSNSSSTVTSVVSSGTPLWEMRVLAAEDNIVNQKVLFRMLDRMGVDPSKITMVENGWEAIRECRGNTFDIVLMDMEMPVMNGLEASQRIRLESLANGIASPKIVFVTAHPREDVEILCMEAGAQSFLSKPINLQELKVVMNSFDSGR